MSSCELDVLGSRWRYRIFVDALGQVQTGDRVV